MYYYYYVHEVCGKFQVFWHHCKTVTSYVLCIKAFQHEGWVTWSFPRLFTRYSMYFILPELTRMMLNSKSEKLKLWLDLWDLVFLYNVPVISRIYTTVVLCHRFVFPSANSKPIIVSVFICTWQLTVRMAVRGHGGSEHVASLVNRRKPTEEWNWFIVAGLFCAEGSYFLWSVKRFDRSMCFTGVDIPLVKVKDKQYGWYPLWQGTFWFRLTSFYTKICLTLVFFQKTLSLPLNSSYINQHCC